MARRASPRRASSLVEGAIALVGLEVARWIESRAVQHLDEVGAERPYEPVVRRTSVVDEGGHDG